MEKMVDLSFYKNKKVFITGHTGFKGSWLVKILDMAGADVIGYSLAPNTSPNAYEQLNIEKISTSYFADIRDLDSLSAAIAKAQPEIVFHLAAQPLVRLSYDNPVDTYTTNVIGTVNILEACRKTPSIKSIVNVTTDKVYENKEWNWGYRENENLCGYDPYSNSKSCSELVTYSYRSCFFSTDNSASLSTARSGNVIGGGDYSLDRIVPDCVKAGMAGKDIIIRNPHSTRPYQHVLDCLSGYLTLAIMQYDKAYIGNYNFGPSDTDCIMTGDLAGKFCDFWGGIKWVNKSDGGPHEANFLKLDCTKAKSILGWYPTWGIDKAIEKTVEWYKVLAASGDLIAITEKQIREFYNL